MSPRELKIGNFVQDFVTGIVEVVRLSRTEINGISDNTYSGIPLTAEWFLRFGFSDNVPKTFYMANKLTEYEFYRINNEVYALSYEGEELDTEIKYVHQLQNLYFALYGEELSLETSN